MPPVTWMARNKNNCLQWKRVDRERETERERERERERELYQRLLGCENRPKVPRENRPKVPREMKEYESELLEEADERYGSFEEK